MLWLPINHSAVQRRNPYEIESITGELQKVLVDSSISFQNTKKDDYGSALSITSVRLKLQTLKLRRDELNSISLVKNRL